VFRYGLRVVVHDVWQTATANLIRQEHLRDVSHGLKTPLSIIRLNAEAMLSGTPLSEEERREGYRDIVRETEELEHQITRMLAGSALEDWTAPRLVPAGVTETLRGSLDAYCRYLAGRGIAVHLDLPVNLPPVRLDAVAVKHAHVESPGGLLHTRGEETIRVGVQGEPAFDLSVLDLGSLRFAGAAPARDSRGLPLASVGKANPDEVTPQVLFSVRGRDLKLKTGDREALFEARTKSGFPIRGTVAVTVAP
jgi:hypothetical protein